MSENRCPSCGAPLDLNATECKYCGEAIVTEQPKNENNEQNNLYDTLQNAFLDMAQCQVHENIKCEIKKPEIKITYNSEEVPVENITNGSEKAQVKNKTVAAILAIFLGTLGIHKFYLGKVKLGILYILFCWTYIPTVLGIIEGIIYLASSDEKFYSKYVKK